MMNRIVVCLATLAVFASSPVWAAEKAPTDAKEVAPDWNLKDLNGNSVSSKEFKGKVIILDFWATWCPPCRAEIPGLIALQKKYQPQGLAVIGVSLDDSGADALKSFVKKNGMNYPVLVGDDKIQRAFGGMDAIPVTFVIDRQGRIIKKHLGLTDKDEFEAEVKPLLSN